MTMIATRAATARYQAAASSHWASEHWRPFLGLLAVFIATIYVFDPREPVTLSGGVVEQQPVHPGDMLKVDWTQDWHRLCHGTTTRTIILPSRHVDFYEAAPVVPPSTPSKIQATGQAMLSVIATEGTGIYRATINFPVQFSKKCIILLPINFTTDDVPFKIAAY
jgi:hypothetical protein